MDVSAIITAACAVAVAVAFPLIGYIVMRRDKDLDKTRDRQDTLSERVREVEIKLVSLDGVREDIKEIRDTLKELVRDLYRLRGSGSSEAKFPAVRIPRRDPPER